MERLYTSNLVTLDRDGDTFTLTVGEAAITGSLLDVYQQVLDLRNSELNHILTDIWFGG